MSVDLSKPVRFKDGKARFYVAAGFPGMSEGIVVGVVLNTVLDTPEFCYVAIERLENIQEPPEPVLYRVNMRADGAVIFGAESIGNDPHAAYFRVSRTESGQTVVEVVKE